MQQRLDPTSPAVESAVERVEQPARDSTPAGRTARGLPGPAWLRENVMALPVAVALVWLSLEGGAYALDVRSTLAIVIWALIALGVAVGLWPRARPARFAIIVGGLLAAFALYQGASVAWADSAEKAFAEFDRVALYLGVFILVVVAARRGGAREWSLGLAVGIVVVGLLALVSRLFPDLLGPSDIQRVNPGDPRLSYPLNYWNGVAILIALGIPLLLHYATQVRTAWLAALAILPVPALAATIYFTSSRGGAVAALVGAGAFIALTTRRFPALIAAATALAGSAVVILALRGKDELVNGRLESDAIAGQGRTAAVVIVLVCLATAAAHAMARRGLRARLRIPVRARRAAIGVAIVVAVGGALAAGLSSRSPDEPAAERYEGGEYVQSHFFSTGDSGRTQFWEAAVDQFESAPVIGGGAGSYQAWWAEHGTTDTFTRNAHSLFFETLGELGAIGLLLLLALVGAGALATIRALRAAPEPDRPLVAALAAAFLTFVLATATDWMWDLTVVALVGIVLLGLLCGPGAAAATAGAPRRPLGWRVGAVAVALALIAGQAIPLLAHHGIRDSQEALREGDEDGALSAAHDARDVQPWAASPHLQVALVEETRGDLAAARKSIERAIDRDPSDWQLWAVAARIEEQAGSPAAARRNFEQARSLNPRSSYFEDAPEQ